MKINKSWISRFKIPILKRRSREYSAKDEKAFAHIYKTLQYQFKNSDLLALALKHRSFMGVNHNSHTESNERLEFLGDAILGLIVTEFLYEKFPAQSEGYLTEIKSLVVSRKILTQVARKIHLGDYLYLGPGEEKSGGRQRISIISDAMEAVFGAIYLDGGTEAVKTVIHRLILSDLDDILENGLNKNYKSQLLEYTQAQGLGTPEYVVEAESGPEHNKLFQISVRVKEKKWGMGHGKSKKQAEQQAAKDALSKINHQGRRHVLWSIF
ncbi:ribonuclease 3 [bacterium BMS3Abin05]|nr:ribonuclease 3 [bacterium BMS3Abin05]